MSDPSPPFDWMTSRLVVKVDDELVTPIDSFTPTLNTNTEVVHSIEQTHIGYITNPSSFTFSLSVRALGPSAAKLTRLAMDGTRFEIALYKQGPGGEWSFEKIVMSDCIITSANPSNATINGAPAASFSGVCLEMTTTPAQGDASVQPPVSE